ALAQLRHPNIVSIHAAGLVGDEPYFVMDHVPGGDLTRHKRTFAGAPERAAALVERVARAVDHAHRAGILHRDLKPSNILIDADGRPLVSDFGVAALLADERPPRSPGDTPGGDTPARQTRITHT